MAAPATSLHTPSQPLNPPTDLPTFPVESVGASVTNDTNWGQDSTLTVSDGYNKATNSDPPICGLAEDGKTQVEVAAAAIFEEATNDPARHPRGSHETEGQKGEQKRGTDSPVPQEAQQTLEDSCAASAACSEVLPVVFTCCVEDVKAADEPVQRSLMIYRQEASIILRQPRVLSCGRANDQRDERSQVRQEAQEAIEESPCNTTGIPEDLVDPLEAMSHPEAEDQPISDGKETQGTNKMERKQDGSCSNTTQDSDSFAPVLLLLVTTAAAAVTIMAAVVHPFGANLSSGIIAIAVFLSLSKWHTSLVTPGYVTLTHGPASHVFLSFTEARKRYIIVELPAVLLVVVVTVVVLVIATVTVMLVAMGRENKNVLSTLISLLNLQERPSRSGKKRQVPCVINRISS